MILNFGSINVDIMMQVGKIPTPGETVLCSQYQIFPGGKGANQAVAAASMGSAVLMCGCVGNDEFGQITLKALKEKGVDTQYVTVGPTPTGCACIAVDPYGENVITVASGANESLKSVKIPDALLLQKPLVMMQMETDLKENCEFLKRAKGFGCSTLLNLAPARKISQESLKNLDYLVMNEVEAQSLGKDLRVPISNLHTLVEFLSKQFQLTAVITRGHKGLLAFTTHGELWDFSAFQVNPVDTTGAGDTFVGVFSAMIDQGHPIHEALNYAVVSGGLCCLNPGAQGTFLSLADIEAHRDHFPKSCLLKGVHSSKTPKKPSATVAP